MSDLSLSANAEKTNEIFDKYKDGLSPEAVIKVDGVNVITKNQMALESIEVDLTMGQPSACTFKIVNAYDIKKRVFKWTEEEFKVGKELTVEMGYAGTTIEVFSGRIETVEGNSGRSEGGTLDVTAYDKSYYMKRAKKTVKWTQKNYSAIASAIGGAYGLTAHCKDMSDEEDFVVVQKNQSDYDFLTTIADESNCQLLVLGDNFYFDDFSDSSKKESLVTLKGDEHLEKFKGKKTCANQVSKVIVKGYDFFNKEVIENEVNTVKQFHTSEDSGAAMLEDIDSDNCIDEIYSTAKTAAEAKAIGEAAINEKEAAFMSGSGTSVGMPDIIAGRYVKFENLGETFDQSFLIVSAKHSMSSAGYKTTFRFGAPKPKKVKSLKEHMPGVYMAEVTGISEKGKILVKLPSRNIEDVEVNIVSTSVGVNAGHYFMPSKGDQVLLSFIEGDVDRPYIMGCVWDATNTIPETITEDNFVRMIKTPGENELYFSDEEGKEKVHLKSKSGHTIVLDDENKQVKLEDSGGSNQLIFETESGAVTINGDKKMTINVGSVSIEIDGTSGGLTLKSTELNLKATNITIEAQASLKIKGNAEVGVESSGMLNLKGSLTKIN